MKGRALMKNCIIPDLPTQRPDDIIGNGQSHSHSPRLGGEIGLEQLIPDLFWNSFPVVAYGNVYHPTGVRLQDDPDNSLPSFRNGLKSVFHQIYKISYSLARCDDKPRPLEHLSFHSCRSCKHSLKA